jgi:HAE1 family hydrophobic/amphiphilic exporter-1
MAEGDRLSGRLVDRPVLAFVLTALVTLAGLAAFGGLEVRELPAVENPVISVSTTYPGAAPEVVDREVTAVVEGAVSRISGIRQVSSSSRLGRSSITLEFRAGVDLDSAANDVRDALARVASSLPKDADPPRAVKADAGGDTVMRLSLSSPTRGAGELTVLAEEQLEGRLLAIDGVADVQINGARRDIFRIDVNQAALAARGLSIADLARAVAAATAEPTAGSLVSARQSLLVAADSAVRDLGALQAVEIAPDVRLDQVAMVHFGPETGNSIVRTNGVAGIGLAVIRQPQSNSLAISRDVRSLVEALGPALPEDVKLAVSFDGATYVRGALAEIGLALTLSVLIVTAVVLAFLNQPMAALVPLLAIPVSLVGTLAALWLVGFSINILTLLALVLATGLVVDDAIVVLENIARHRALGLAPRDAAIVGTREVLFAVLATTATLAAVFMPLAFLPGRTGGLFREFGFTLAIAVTVSAFVALVFCPVLAARVLAVPGPVSGRPGFLQRSYDRLLAAALRAPAVVLTLALVAIGTAALFLPTLRSELVPPEDRGFLPLQVQAPQGVSVGYTSGRMDEIYDGLASLVAAGEVANIFSFAGTSGGNRGFIGVSLADWSARERSQQEIAADVARKTAEVIGVRVTIGQPNSLAIRGAGQGLSFALTGTDYDEMAGAADLLIDRLRQDPAMGQVRLGYDRTQPQLKLAIDRTRAEDLGIDGARLGEALQTLLDGRTIGTVFIGDRAHDVRLASSSEPLDDPGDLGRVFVPTAEGQMVPLGAFATLTEEAVAPDLAREGLRRAITVSASLSEGLSLGDAIARLDAAAADLPEGIGIELLAEARILKESSVGVATTFAFALVIVLLLLAAQFESFTAAFVILSTVPVGLACAVLALAAVGMSLNLYSQIGLVMVVGIMAKNGILVVEFANQLRARGMAAAEAVSEAARIRFRPVMMTMLSTVLGALPLVLTQGPGAEARIALGWVILGGLGPAGLATLFLIPVVWRLAVRDRSRPDARPALNQQEPTP